MVRQTYAEGCHLHKNENRCCDDDDDVKLECHQMIKGNMDCLRNKNKEEKKTLAVIIIIILYLKVRSLQQLWYYHLIPLSFSR